MVLGEFCDEKTSTKGLFLEKEKLDTGDFLKKKKTGFAWRKVRKHDWNPETARSAVSRGVSDNVGNSVELLFERFLFLHLNGLVRSEKVSFRRPIGKETEEPRSGT